MTAYPDASFLCAAYRPQANSDKAIHHLGLMGEPLCVSSPLVFEFKQSIRWQTFWHSKNQSKRFDRQSAQEMLGAFQANVAAGLVRIVPVDWAEVVGVAERLSAQYTWTQGNRGFDIIHVATALYLGAEQFLTFDTKQKALAKAEGLKLPL